MVIFPLPRLITRGKLVTVISLEFVKLNRFFSSMWDIVGIHGLLSPRPWPQGCDGDWCALRQDPARGNRALNWPPFSLPDRGFKPM